MGHGVIVGAGRVFAGGEHLSEAPQCGGRSCLALCEPCVLVALGMAAVSPS